MSDTAYQMLKDEHQQRERYLQSLLDKIAKLKAENAKLEKLAEQAKILKENSLKMNVWELLHCIDYAEDFNEALAALEALDEEG